MAAMDEFKKQTGEFCLHVVRCHKQCRSPVHRNFLLTTLVLIITLLSFSRLCQGNFIILLLLL